MKNHVSKPSSWHKTTAYTRRSILLHLWLVRKMQIELTISWLASMMVEQEGLLKCFGLHLHSE
jgi:hypothetical protein